jgi:hypothetical protein
MVNKSRKPEEIIECHCPIAAANTVWPSLHQAAWALQRLIPHSLRTPQAQMARYLLLHTQPSHGAHTTSTSSVLPSMPCARMTQNPADKAGSMRSPAWRVRLCCSACAGRIIDTPASATIC